MLIKMFNSCMILGSITFGFIYVEFSWWIACGIYEGPIIISLFRLYYFFFTRLSSSLINSIFYEFNQLYFITSKFKYIMDKHCNEC